VCLAGHEKYKKVFFTFLYTMLKKAELPGLAQLHAKWLTEVMHINKVYPIFSGFSKLY